MRTANLGRISRSCFKALMVLLVWASVDRSQVLADCRSHEVTTIRLSDEVATGLTWLDRAGERALADLTEIPGRSKPCTGPMCSSRPPMPLAPATPDVQRIASWAILEVATPVLISEPSGSHLDGPGVRPSHHTGSIFHPPRLTSPLITS